MITENHFVYRWVVRLMLFFIVYFGNGRLKMHCRGVDESGGDSSSFGDRYVVHDGHLRLIVFARDSRRRVSGYEEPQILQHHARIAECDVRIEPSQVAGLRIALASGVADRAVRSEAILFRVACSTVLDRQEGIPAPCVIQWLDSRVVTTEVDSFAPHLIRESFHDAPGILLERPLEL